MKNISNALIATPQSCTVNCPYTDLWSYFTNDIEVFSDEFLPDILANVPVREAEVDLWSHTNLDFLEVKDILYIEELLLQLPENYLFENQIVFYENIRQLLDKQKHGEKGTLVTNGRANTFFLRVDDQVFSVKLFWVEKSILWRRKNVWSVRASNIAEHFPKEKSLSRLRWGGGSKIFLP